MLFGVSYEIAFKQLEWQLHENTIDIYRSAGRSAFQGHAYTLHVIDRKCHYPADNWLQRSDELPLRGFEI